MNRRDIRKMIKQLNFELQNAVQSNDTENTLRCMFGLGILKDALLESYGETYATDSISPVIPGHVNITKNSPTNLTGPFKIAK